MGSIPGQVGLDLESLRGNYLAGNTFQPLDRSRPVTGSDAIRAFDHPFRQNILRKEGIDV